MRLPVIKNKSFIVVMLGCKVLLWLLEMIAQLNRQLPSNINRERRAPYQHPKGAPDADVIFGSKYVFNNRVNNNK